MNTRTTIRNLISLILIVGIASLLWFRFFYVPNYPEGVLSEPHIYLIKPETILVSLNQGDKNVFTPASSEPDRDWPQLWPPGSFSWDQKDYLKIADGLHQLVWKESLENWRLIRAYFRIDQCQDIFGKIDAANFSYYQYQNGLSSVHGFWINPLYGYVEAGDEISNRGGWTTKSINLGDVKINTVGMALSVAEENGGKEVRSTVKNQCRITLLLAPDRITNDFLAHPFTRYGWGWNVIYWPNESNSEPLLSMMIDPYTGSYKIQH